MVDAAVDFQLLADSCEFVEFFAIARELTGISVALVDPAFCRSKKLYQSEELNPLCHLIQSDSEGLRRCHRCDTEHGSMAAKDGKAVVYRCHAGLVDMVIPIHAEGRHVANISCGQLLTGEPSEEGLDDLHKRTRALKIDRVALRESYEQSPWVTEGRLEHIQRLFTFFADYFCEVGVRRAVTAETEQAQYVEAATVHIRRNFRNALVLADVAIVAGVSPAYLSHLFTKETGESFTTVVQRVRVAEAARLLRNSPRTITKIAFDSGFNNITHFNRVFRRHMHLSPGQYRDAEADDAGGPTRHLPA